MNPPYKKNLSWNNKPVNPLQAANFSSISSCSSGHHLNGSEFSFHKVCDNDQNENSNSNGSIPSTLRHDLYKLDKNQLIELLVEEIEENRQNRNQNFHKQLPTSVLIAQNNRLKDNQSHKAQLEIEDQNWRTKYQQLAMYMQQYINNTNQANQQFIDIIQTLKKQKQTLETQSKEFQNLSIQYKRQKQHYKASIMDLEQTVQRYMEINNSNVGKYEKLKILYEKATHDLEAHQQTSQYSTTSVKGQNYYAMNSRSRSNKSIGSESLIESKQQISPFILKQTTNQLTTVNRNYQVNEHSQKMKVMNIQIRQLRGCNEKMHIQLQKKSSKIRKLLEEIEKLSEQKWHYKQFYLQHCLENNKL